MVRSDLDSVRLIVDVEHTLLDLLVDLLGRVYKRLLHIRCRTRRRLHEHQIVLPGERLALLPLHFTA